MISTESTLEAILEGDYQEGKTYSFFQFVSETGWQGTQITVEVCYYKISGNHSQYSYNEGDFVVELWEENYFLEYRHLAEEEKSIFLLRMK